MILNDILGIYFPVAEIRLSLLVVLGIGFVSGIMSGLLGIGGGFVSTPLLTAVGVPPAVAVATSAHQIIGSSFSGILPRLKVKKIDFKLGFTLAGSGIIGACFGAFLFQLFEKLGNINIVISLFYVVLMSFISFISFRTYFSKSNPGKLEKPPIRINFLNVYFKVAEVRCSILIPIACGMFTGVLTVIMGVGGGFVLVPAMVSLMKIKNDVAVGTSLLQILFITIFVVLFHIFKTGLIDLMLGILLISGASIGAQISSALSLKIGKRKVINLLLAILTLTVAIKFAADLFFSDKDEQILIEELRE